MAQILVRKLDDALAARMKERAKRKGISLEEEARRMLAKADDADLKETIARIDAIRLRTPPGTLSAVEIVRADRDRER